MYVNKIKDFSAIAIKDVEFDESIKVSKPKHLTQILTYRLDPCAGISGYELRVPVF